MSNIEYRENLAKYHNKTMIFEGRIRQKSKNVIKITRSNKIRKEQYRLLLLDLYILVDKDKKSYICDHVNIFLGKKRSENLEVGDLIRFKGLVKKYKSYKEVIKDLVIKVDNYGICKIKEIEKVDEHEEDDPPIN